MKVGSALKTLILFGLLSAVVGKKNVRGSSSKEDGKPPAKSGGRNKQAMTQPTLPQTSDGVPGVAAIQPPHPANSFNHEFPPWALDFSTNSEALTESYWWGEIFTKHVEEMTVKGRTILLQLCSSATATIEEFTAGLMEFFDGHFQNLSEAGQTAVIRFFMLLGNKHGDAFKELVQEAAATESWARSDQVEEASAVKDKYIEAKLEDLAGTVGHGDNLPASSRSDYDNLRNLYRRLLGEEIDTRTEMERKKFQEKVVKHMLVVLGLVSMALVAIEEAQEHNNDKKRKSVSSDRNEKDKKQKEDDSDDSGEA